MEAISLKQIMTPGSSMDTLLGFVTCGHSCHGAYPLPICPRSDGVRESANKSDASAASPDYVKFQAVIKSAAGAASRKPKSREGNSRGVLRGRRPPAEPPSFTPLELPSLDLGFLEAALAVDVIMA